jgi:lipid-binding SYLF domain-containing protein
MNRSLQCNRFVVTLLVLALALISAAPAQAESKTEIDIKVQGALTQFKKQVMGGDEFLKKAKGVLVFPEVLKAGFGIGGEYGEGALLIHGKTVGYYSTASASIGFQLGAQVKTEMLVFLDSGALEKFRHSDGWKVGVDGSVALVTLGAGKDINSMNVNQPIVGFIFNNKGLMYNLTLEGSKITRLNK